VSDIDITLIKLSMTIAKNSIDNYLNGIKDVDSDMANMSLKELCEMLKYSRLVELKEASEKLQIALKTLE